MREGDIVSLYVGTNQTNDFLEHYGVKGMKWGVRRATKRMSKASTTKQKDRAINKLVKQKGKLGVASQENYIRVKRRTAALKAMDEARVKKANKHIDKGVAHTVKAANYINSGKKRSAAREIAKSEKEKTRANRLLNKTMGNDKKLSKYLQNQKTYVQLGKEVDKAVISNGQEYLEEYLKRRR